MARRFARCCLPVAWALLAVALAPACAAPIVLYMEDYPPYSWHDMVANKATGLSADVVAELMRRADLAAAAPAVVPWARGMAQTIATRNTCLFSTTRTPEREANFAWIGPIARNEWVMFARRDDRIVLASLNDARKYQVGAIIGDAANALLADYQIKLSVTGSHKLNAAKLQAQRIQLWSTGRLPGRYLLNEMGMYDIEAVLSFVQFDMYLACNKDMDKAEIVRLNELLRSMYRDGTVQRIYAQYGFEKDAPRIEAGAR